MKTTIIERQLAGYTLATAEIIYRMPDHLELLQSYVWQEYDLVPEYPELQRFLKFWKENLDGPLVSVTVGSRELFKRGEWRHTEALLTLH
ncbi:usg protein [Denitrobaculum tricleocarpae]|uniref:Usg family protein n=1 Tax=Denitrobaculum tricleocarpae TaxID=2591009 RepID=A0A545TUG9_9PROT|nr:hypothetical protein [Denitrobaculum tricleocarpae]TQV80864.1 hypothetical protein FKG95_12000 [Denitrobaculum tricleocarpae]